jgi:hypothetical protein
LVEDSPVESDVSLLCAVLRPVDEEVDSDVTLLFVDESPVERDVSRLTAVLTPVDADVDSDPA